MEFEKFLVSVILNKEQHCRVCLRTDKERRLVSADTYRKLIGRVLSLKNYGVHKERELLDAFETNLKMHQNLTKYCITETLTIDSTDKDPIDLTNDYQPLNPNIAGIDNNIILIPSGAKFIDYITPNQAITPNTSGIQILNQPQTNSIQVLNQSRNNTIQTLNQTQSNTIPVLNQMPNANSIQFMNQAANFQALNEALSSGQVQVQDVSGGGGGGGWQLIQIIDPTQQANVSSEGNQIPNFMNIVPQTHVKTSLNNITQLNLHNNVNTTAGNVAQVKMTSNVAQVRMTSSVGQVKMTPGNFVQVKTKGSNANITDQAKSSANNADKEQNLDGKKSNRLVHRVEDEDCIAIIETNIFDDDRPTEAGDSEDACIIPDSFVDLSDDSSPKPASPKGEQFIVPVALSKLQADAPERNAFTQLPTTGDNSFYGALSGPITSTVPIHDTADVNVVKSIEGRGQYVIVGGTNLVFVPSDGADSTPPDMAAAATRKRVKYKDRTLPKLMPKPAPAKLPAYPALPTLPTLPTLPKLPTLSMLHTLSTLPTLPAKPMLRDLLAEPTFQAQEQPKEANWPKNCQNNATSSNAVSNSQNNPTNSDAANATTDDDDVATTDKQLEVIELDCSTLGSQMEDNFKLPMRPRVYGQPIKPVPKDKTIDWEDKIPMEVITYADGSPMPQQTESGLGKISEVYSEAPSPTKRHKL